MPLLFWQILIVLVLTLFNGFFSCAEIALITVRKTRIHQLAKQGSKRAGVVKDLQSRPENLFATMQIGISILSVFASVFAGSSIAEKVGTALSQANIPFLSNHAYSVSFVIIVLLLSFVSLILGELVPKSLGLRYAENYALLAAYPIWWFSKLSYLLVRPLIWTSNLILKPFNDSTSFKESRMSEDEIRSMLSEGQKAGTLNEREHDMIENVFEFSDLTVGKIMVPRPQIIAFNINAPATEIVKQAIDSGYSRLPIYQDTFNNIVGILYTKKLLKTLGDTRGLKLEEFLLPPYFVPSSMKISEVMQRLQRKRLHMALVTNEHGEIEGLATLEDLVEEIVGEISDETDEANKTIVKQPDQSFLVAGKVSILDFNRYFNSQLPEDEDFTTISGFILNRLGHFPKEGELISFNDWEFTVKEKDLRTVKTAVVNKK